MPRPSWRFRSIDLFTRPHLKLIALVGLIVPRRLRMDWRQEWEAELCHREQLLTDWDRLDWSNRLDLVRRSMGAFWDALWLQRQRREDEVVQDLRFGVRMLWKTPGFTFMTVTMLALGIGGNAAIFSVVNALLLRPLGGVVDPDRLVQVGRQYADKNYISDSSYPDFVDYRAQNTTLSGLAAIVPTAFHVSTGQAAERVEGELVSADYFDVLKVTPALGRLIMPADVDSSATPVAVLSFRLWQRQFAAAADVIGQTIKLDGHDVVVIGVASETFTGIKVGSPRDVWTPMAILRLIRPEHAARFSQRQASWLEMFGRLEPGTTLDQARAEFSVLAERLRQAYPQSNARAGVRVEPGLGRDTEVRNELRRFAVVPFAAVGIVLLIACANVAGLLLARAAARRKEIAVRLALGAGRIRIVRQLLTENMTLALVGGMAGLLVGVWLTTWLRSLLPERYLFLSFNLDFGLDWRVFGFTLLTAILTGVLSSVLPALHSTKPDLVPTLKGGRRQARPAGRHLRSALVVAQVALSLVLLIAAGLCIRTLHNVAAIDTGYETAQVLTARIDLEKQGYDEARGRIFQRDLVERLQAVPGVRVAGLAVTLPLNDSRWENGIVREGDTARIQTFQNVVSTRYLEAMSIPIVLGRAFSDGDAQLSPVAIVNQTLAHRLWPNESPLGKRVRMGQPMEVIGMAQDIKGRDLLESPGPMLYVPLSQQYQPNTVLHLRTSAAPAALARAVRHEVAALDRNLPVYGIQPLSEHVTAALTPQRLLAHLIASFGLLSLVLAGIGLYGLLAYTVSQRTPEIGIRRALGAQRGAVLRLVVAQGMTLALVGVGLGLTAAFAVTRLLQGLLFGVSALDPLTFATLALLLIGVTLLACYIPARRAVNVEPKTALRYE